MKKTRKKLVLLPLFVFLFLGYGHAQNLFQMQVGDEEPVTANRYVKLTNVNTPQVSYVLQIWQNGATQPEATVVVDLENASGDLLVKVSDSNVAPPSPYGGGDPDGGPDLNIRYGGAFDSPKKGQNAFDTLREHVRYFYE